MQVSGCHVHALLVRPFVCPGVSLQRVGVLPRCPLPWATTKPSRLPAAASTAPVTAAEAGAEASAACSTASSLLDALFPAVLAALRSGEDEVAAAVVPFLLSYVARLKALQKRAGGQLSPEDAAHLPPILEALACAARFADDSSAYEAVAASATQR